MKNESEINNSGLDTTHLHWDSWDWQCNLRSLPDNSLPPSYTSVLQDCPTINFNDVKSTNADHVGNNVSPGASSGTPSILSPPLTPVHKFKQGENYVFLFSSSAFHKLCVSNSNRFTGDYVQRSPGSVSDNCRYNSHAKYADDITVVAPSISKSRSHESQLYNISSNSNGKGSSTSNFTFTK